MGLVEPLPAIIVSFCLFGILLYKKVNLGIILSTTALFLALLSLDWQQIPLTIVETATQPLTISIVAATFGIMWLSQLYKETSIINKLSESLSRIMNNSKLVLSVLPAVIGFLPVAGGALMSAPLVDSEAEKLKLKPEKKAYVNLWFRHTIFPVYPISPVLIVTASLTGLPVFAIILRQIPVVAVMVIVGFLIGFWKIANPKKEESVNKGSDFKIFFVAFSPILITILIVIILDLVGLDLAKNGFDVVIATFIGLMTLIAISKPDFQTFLKPVRNWGIYGITLAAFGAFLLRSVMVNAGISQIFASFATNGSVDTILLLTVAPAVLGFLTGSPSGGVAIAVSILAGILTFSPKTAALLYISAYLGYVIAPTHLCFSFTADYFKCSLRKIYKYLIPSFIISYTTALIIYYLI